MDNADLCYCCRRRPCCGLCSDPSDLVQRRALSDFHFTAITAPHQIAAPSDDGSGEQPDSKHLQINHQRMTPDGWASFVRDFFDE